MDSSDQERCTLPLKVVGGAENTLSPQIPTLPGCKCGIREPKQREKTGKVGAPAVLRS